MRVQRLVGQVAVTLAFLCAAAPIGAQTVTVFDVPGSTGTFSSAISPNGMVAGSYRDATGVDHGFIRDEQGQYTTFDPPASVDTSVSGFGHAGSVFGSYVDANDAVHGYVRERGGAITAFDVPGAVSTTPTSINAAGEIAGSYSYDYIHFFSFVRDAQGNFSLFPEFFITSINNRGDVVGNLFDVAAQQRHNFIRDRKGNITIFDVGELESNVASINEAGTIVGTYATRPGDLRRYHGFLRDQAGNITSFDVPFGGICEDCPPTAWATFSTKVNQSGEVIGIFTLSSRFLHPTGFFRDASGNFTTFSLDTQPLDINARGQVTGYYPDFALNVYRGFIFSK